MRTENSRNELRRLIRGCCLLTPLLELAFRLHPFECENIANRRETTKTPTKQRIAKLFFNLVGLSLLKW